MEEKRLLIFGSVKEFNRLTQYSVERGIHTVVVDAYQGEAKKFATKSYDVDLRDNDLVDQIIKEERIDHIISSYSDNMFEMMVNASNRNNLPTFCPISKVRYLRDKGLMKNMFEELGIRTANAQMIDIENFSGNNIKTPFPCVVKPLDGWGSKGVKLVHDFQELTNYLSKTISFSTSGRYALLEEINMGYEINVMSWIKDGKAYIIELGDRETTGMTKDKLPHQSREVFPSIYYKEVESRVREMLEKISRYCEIQEGPLSIQLFYESGDISVGEVAGRFFGDAQGLVPVINRIDLNELLINMLYFPNENYELLKNEKRAFDHCSIALYLLPERGIVRDLGNIMEFKNEHCDEYKVYVKPGMSTTMAPWIVSVFAHFNTRKEADEYTRNIYNNLYVPGLDGKNLVMTNKLVVYDGKKWKNV